MHSSQSMDVIIRCASEAGIKPASLLAVIEVETGGKAFATIDGRQEPLIRFEGHYFDRRLSPAERERARKEGLSSPNVGVVRNPPGQWARWKLLERAAAINARAAYEATSWGVGQVMGAHWQWLEYLDVYALVAEARSGLEGQLRLMLRYIVKAGLADALSRGDWAEFAHGYNGPGYRKNSYHVRLAMAFRRHQRGVSPKGADGTWVLGQGDRGSSVRHLQSSLSKLGYTLALDGIFGPQTRAALLAFQTRSGLAADGIFGPLTRTALEKALSRETLMRRVQNAIRSLWECSQAWFRRW